MVGKGQRFCTVSFVKGKLILVLSHLCCPFLPSFIRFLPFQNTYFSLPIKFLTSVIDMQNHLGVQRIT